MQCRAPRRDGISQPAYLAHQAQVGRQEFDVGIVACAADVVLRSGAFGAITPGQDDLQALARESACDFLTDPVGAAGDQCSPPPLARVHSPLRTGSLTDITNSRSATPIWSGESS